MFKKLLFLQWKFILISVKSIFSSKIDYYIGTFSLFLIQISSLLFIYIAFVNKGTIAGYTKPEVLLFFGISFTIQALVHWFCEGLWLLGPKYIIRGNLDYLIIRPVSPLFQIIMANLHSSGIINFIFGSLLIIYNLTLFGFSLKYWHFLLLLYYILIGFIINFSIILFISCLSFKHGRVTSIISIFTLLQRFFAYPLDIFPQLFIIFFTFFLPLAFASYFPVLNFIDMFHRNDHSAIIFLFQVTTIGLISLFIGLNSWKKGLKEYQSSLG